MTRIHPSVKSQLLIWVSFFHSALNETLIDDIVIIILLGTTGYLKNNFFAHFGIHQNVLYVLHYRTFHSKNVLDNMDLSFALTKFVP